MVTANPADLSRPQRAPHFDSTDQKYSPCFTIYGCRLIAGTAFYRQRSTGIERVTEANIAKFVSTAEAEATLLAAGTPATF